MPIDPLLQGGPGASPRTASYASGFAARFALMISAPCARNFTTSSGERNHCACMKRPVAPLRTREPPQLPGDQPPTDARRRLVHELAQDLALDPLAIHGRESLDGVEVHFEGRVLRRLAIEYEPAVLARVHSKLPVSASPALQKELADVVMPYRVAHPCRLGCGCGPEATSGGRGKLMLTPLIVL